MSIEAALDLFGNPVTLLLLVRLDRQIDRDKPCCHNVAIVGPGKAQHAAELRCASCDAHRGWLRREALDFLTNLSQRFGAPAEPIILRDSSIGDHTMAEKKYDNCGILFRNKDKTKDADRDYRGSITIAGTEYWLSTWIKDGKRGKFMSLSVKPKEKRSSAFGELNDKIPF
jgi:hypothetical protein